ncbi:MAG: hypothetical protein NTU53_01045 [Planctomycetota bacterium]|nr:hypothetical protein [Planctomycetota bacterium]
MDVHHRVRAAQAPARQRDVTDGLAFDRVGTDLGAEDVSTHGLSQSQFRIVRVRLKHGHARHRDITDGAVLGDDRTRNVSAGDGDIADLAVRHAERSGDAAALDRDSADGGVGQDVGGERPAHGLRHVGRNDRLHGYRTGGTHIQVAREVAALKRDVAQRARRLEVNGNAARCVVVDRDLANDHVAIDVDLWLTVLVQHWFFKDLGLVLERLDTEVADAAGDTDLYRLQPAPARGDIADTLALESASNYLGTPNGAPVDRPGTRAGVE